MLCTLPYTLSPMLKPHSTPLLYNCTLRFRLLKPPRSTLQCNESVTIPGPNLIYHTEGSVVDRTASHILLPSIGHSFHVCWSLSVTSPLRNNCQQCYPLLFSWCSSVSSNHVTSWSLSVFIVLSVCLPPLSVGR